MPGWEQQQLKAQFQAGFAHAGVAVATEQRDAAHSWRLQQLQPAPSNHPSVRAQPSAPKTRPSFENHLAKTAFHDNLNAPYLFLHPAFAAAFLTGSQVKYPVSHRYQQVTKMLLCTALQTKQCAPSNPTQHHISTTSQYLLRKSQNKEQLTYAH